MNTQKFVKTINNLRKPNKWYSWSGDVNGKTIKIKGFETWLQVFIVNGRKVHSAMDISVTKFKQNLARGVT